MISASIFIYREDRIRTCDPLVPNQVLYQAELLPGDHFVKNAPNRSRTCNRLIRSQVLYPIELWVQKIVQSTIKKLKRKTGFEPATPTLARWCSTTELLPRMVPAKGFEPSTLWLQIRCSTNWAKPAYSIMRVKGLEPPRLAALDPKSSASANSATPANELCRARTCDPLIKSQMLYQLS